MKKTDPRAKYTDNHEWARKENGLITIGITDFAQTVYKQLFLVELPKVGTVFKKGDIFCIVESDKAASEILMPVGGKIVAINLALSQTPSLINEDCYEKGWLVKIEAADTSEWDSLMTENEYRNEIGVFFNKI